MLTGEPLALDLVNTRASTPDGEIDALADLGGLRTWLDAQGGRLVATGSISESDLAAVRELRHQVGLAIEAARCGRRPSSIAVAAINDAVREAPQYYTAHWSDNGLDAQSHRTGDARAIILAQLAEAAVDLLTGPSIAKIRACEGPQCRMLFLPAHPRRRWCSPALCGNRVRVARYYQRHKAE